MPFNISEFHANISRTGGVALNNLFEIEVPSTVGKTVIGTLKTEDLSQAFIDTNFVGPSLTTIMPLLDARSMSFRISSFDAPGRTIVDAPSRDYGPQRRVGTSATYGDVTLSIIVSPDLRERQYFIKWQDLIVGNHRNKDLDSDARKKQFNIGYYNNYVSDGIKLKYYAPNSNVPTYEMQLIEAYPIMIGNIPFAWGSDDVIQMQVTLAYRYYLEEYKVMDFQPERRSTGILERLNQLGIGGGLGTLGGIAAGKLGSRVATAAFAGAAIAGRIF